MDTVIPPYHNPHFSTEAQGAGNIILTTIVKVEIMQKVRMWFDEDFQLKEIDGLINGHVGWKEDFMERHGLGVICQVGNVV